MGYWEDLGRHFTQPAIDTAKLASNPITLRKADTGLNSLLGNIQAGLPGLVNNPYVGGAVNAALPVIQQGINKYGEFAQSPLGKAAIPAISTAMGMAGNIPGAAANILASQIKPPTEDQLKRQREQQFINTQIQEAGKQAQKKREDLSKKGNIQDIPEIVMRNTIEAPAFLGGVGGYLTSAAQEVPNLFQGKGYHPMKRYEEEAAPYVDAWKRDITNKALMGNKGKDYLYSLPKETVDNLPDEVFKALYEGKSNPNIDLMSAIRDAERLAEVKVVQDFVRAKLDKGEINVDQAMQIVQSQEAGQQMREAGSWLLDPTLAIPGGPGKKIAQAETKLATKGAKELRDVSKIIDEYGKIPTQINQKISKVDDYGKIPTTINQKVDDYGKIPTQIDTSVVEAPKTAQKLAQVSKPMETQKVIKKAKSNAVKPEKIAETNIENQINEIKSLVDGIDSKDAAEVALFRTSQKINESNDVIANKIYAKLTGLSEDVPVQPNLTSVYTPPKVGLNSKGELMHLPESNLPPVEITFRNPFQKVMYEMAMPYNKAIAQGYGMDWKSYVERSSNITKSMVEPLADIIAGNQAPEFLNRIKSVLGGIGSEIAKYAAKNPGKPIVFDDLMNSKKLDGLLSRVSRPEKIKQTLADGVENLKNLSREERRRMAAESIITKRYEDTVNKFTEMGLDPDLAERVAPYYTKNLKAFGLGNTQGMIVGADKQGTTAGKAYLAGIYDDVDKAVAVEIHEDTHQIFDYLRASTKDQDSIIKFFTNTLHQDLDQVGKKYLSGLIRTVKNLDTAPENVLDEMVAYYVQAKEATRKGLTVESSVINKYQNLILKARNGDDQAAMLLDNMESITNFVRKYGDEYEQGLVNELQNTRLPDGSTAWDKVNNLDPTNIKGMYPGEKYGKVSNLGEAGKYLEDANARMNRLNQLMEGQNVVYRGTTKPLSTGKPRTNYGSIDQMYGPGTYTSTNPAQAFGYTGLGEGKYMDQPRLKANVKNATFKGYYQGLERPLFWDEQVPLDIITTLEKSTDPNVKKAFEHIGGVEEISLMSMGDFVKDFPMALEEVMSPAIKSGSYSVDELQRAKKVSGPLMVEEVYKKAGYDGFVGPSTDEALGYANGGYEVVPFEGHNLLERTPEMRKTDLAARSKKATKTKNFTLTPAPLPDAPNASLKDLTDQINHIQDNTAKGINYHINRGLE